jgi:hypothetical protein
LVTSTPAKILALSEMPGQALVQDLGVEVVEVQVDVILSLADAAAGADLHGHGAGDHVAGGEILRGRSIALHEALASELVR